MAKFRLVAVAAVVGSACSVAEPNTAQVVSAILPGGDGCPREECGGSGNSPVMDGVYFWSLNVNGKVNNQGFWLVSAEKAGAPLWLRLGAPGDRWRAVVKASPAVVYEHLDLREVTFTVQRGWKQFQVRIADVFPDHQPFWAKPTTDDPGNIETYDLRFTPLNDPAEPREEHFLCSHPTGDPGELYAIVFGGDIYDATTKRITIGGDAAGWFNIACFMGAPWKMHVAGHTGVANFRLGIDTSLDKRRAMLNAWTMNACGTGTAFTHPGEPITMHEQPEVFIDGLDYLKESNDHEAIWGPNGALCLDAPRLWEEDAEIRSKIQAECGGRLPPSCSTTLPVGDQVSTSNLPG